MASFCAICTRDAGPFVQCPLGRNDALVTVCQRCDEEAPQARSSERGYESPDYAARLDQAISAIAREHLSAYDGSIEWQHKAAKPSPGIRSVDPGFMLVRAPVKRDGRTRGHREAALDFVREDWADELMYLGSSSGFHLWQRPRERARDEAGLAEVVGELEQWRSKS